MLSLPLLHVAGRQLPILSSAGGRSPIEMGSSFWIRAEEDLLGRSAVVDRPPIGVMLRSP
jgi:hypothetical protein